MKLIDNIFGTHSQRELKRVEPIIKKIEAFKPEIEKLNDEELRNKTKEFKERLAAGETKESILPEAYAVVREAGKRALGMEHFRVQLIGGVILHQGRIAEMRTGEGKTLVSTLPAYLNALDGKGVHVVTVNDYLAKRDAEQMGKVHEFLGLTVGVVLANMNKAERQAAYNCDITYITNNELGFDYLRDNMCQNKEDQVQRGLNYCIVDEIDSVLIDEARTPLIISGQSGKSTELYNLCDAFVIRLERGQDMPELTKADIIMGVEREETGDYIVDEKNNNVVLTEQGVEKAERFFHVDNLADPDNLELQHNINLALRAHSLMHKDKDYVVKDDQVLIVDGFTGRIMPGRRYSDGLHQAIEAKEHVKIKRESVTLATITFQSFFNKYGKLSGMTGTASTEEQEFRDIYGMDVVTIPTNRPIKRIDHDDAVYATKKEKYNAIVEETKKAHEKGQPVLVGTANIEVSEILSELFTKAGLEHNVLNAKFHEREAEIVADAGKHGAVTIATNMAGRGTDIKLDDKAREAGGLKIIGSERHESRRIDNQLRGRSGRQGDVGETQFFISLEDDLMRLFGSDKLVNLFKTLGVPEGEQIKHKMLSSAIEKAQKKIEENNFASRKNLLEYDIVVNKQREIVYSQRDRILNGEDVHKSILDMTDNKIDQCVDATIVNLDDCSETEFHSLNKMLCPIIPVVPVTETSIGNIKNTDDLKKALKALAHAILNAKAKEFESEEQFKAAERMVLLKVVDFKWMKQIDDMEQLRQSVSLMGYGQKNPVEEYKMQSFDMFEEMNAAIIDETLMVLFRINPVAAVQAA